MEIFATNGIKSVMREGNRIDFLLLLDAKGRGKYTFGNNTRPLRRLRRDSSFEAESSSVSPGSSK